MVTEEAKFPRSDGGYFHLTPKGWVRKDVAPFPQDRCETWAYEMEWPAEDAKEQVTLTKVWVAPTATAASIIMSRQEGIAVKAAQSRLDCHPAHP